MMNKNTSEYVKIPGKYDCIKEVFDTLWQSNVGGSVMGTKILLTKI